MHVPRPSRLLAVFLLFCALPAGAQVRRCMAADGTMVFTDRRCQDVGAVERLPAAPPVANAHVHRSACSRTLQDLVYALTSAIDSGDVNRFAGVYYWVGASSGNAYSIMDRLQVIVQRPLVDVVPIYSASGEGDGDYYPRATTRRAPIGLRLEQTLGNGSTPSTTVLGLRRYLDCWWVHL